MKNIFEEANQATDALFSEEPSAEENAEQTAEAEGGEEVTPPAEEQMLADAANTAETAARLAEEKDNELQQVLQQNRVLQEQVSQMQGTLEEMSRQNEEQVLEEALELPELDFESLAFADEETKRTVSQKYQEDLLAYQRAAIMKELAPFVEQAKAGMYEKEKSEVLAALAEIPELAEISSPDMLHQLDRIIANNKWLSAENMPMDERYINAYAIARGVNSMNLPQKQPKELSVEEMMKLYNEKPEFQEMVEKQRISQLKNSQQVPTHSASSGAVNAALDIPDTPKTWDDADYRSAELFRRMSSRK